MIFHLFLSFTNPEQNMAEILRNPKTLPIKIPIFLSPRRTVASRTCHAIYCAPPQADSPSASLASHHHWAKGLVHGLLCIFALFFWSNLKIYVMVKIGHNGINAWNSSENNSKHFSESNIRKEISTRNFAVKSCTNPGWSIKTKHR